MAVCYTVDMPLAFVEVGTVVVGLDTSFGIRSIDVKGIQVSADGLDRSEALGTIRRSCGNVTKYFRPE